MLTNSVWLNFCIVSIQNIKKKKKNENIIQLKIFKIISIFPLQKFFLSTYQLIICNLIDRKTAFIYFFKIIYNINGSEKDWLNLCQIRFDFYLFWFWIICVFEILILLVTINFKNFCFYKDWIHFFILIYYFVKGKLIL